ncbi:MAG: hypothetical protein HYZ10_12590 [Ignavibacteriales bacterium]|nr:hypothetical protein [Ignavibacteriales bacterium]
MKTTIRIFILLVAITSINFAQIKFTSVGASFGIGTIQGNSTSVSALSGSISTDFKLWFSDVVSFRLGYTHARMTEYFLPENRTNKYYPFFNFYTLKGVIYQPLYKKLFIEEAAGILVLNDRTFGDTNIWEFGGTFSLLAGLDFRDLEMKGITVGLSTGYGVTLTSTNASYSFFSLNAQYYF